MIANTHAIIEPGSQLWWQGLTITFGTMALAIYTGYKSEAAREKIAKLTGSVFIALAILIHPYMIYLGKWNLQSSLPLNLCSISGILSGVVLFWRNQLAYELLLYWGLPAALHSLLTPEMTLGNQGLIIYDYYISHGGIVFSALYLSIVLGMRPRKNSWLVIFLYTQLLLPVVGTIDWLLDANYMYLLKKPIANNPVIIGEWPWYLVILEGVVLAHFYLVYLAFQIGKRKIIVPVEVPYQK